MAYTIAYSDSSKTGITIQDNNINNSTSVGFVGQNAPGYGKVINENFLHILENFASVTPPTSPISGQLWYDKNTSVFKYGQLKVHDGGKWGPVNGLWIQDTDPLLTTGTDNQRTPSAGEIWVETVGMQLKVFNGESWALIGPPTPANIDMQSGSYAERILSNDGVTQYDVIKNFVSGEVVSIISGADFIPQSIINGFSSGLKPGVNLSSAITGTLYNGNATSANGLTIRSVTVPGASFVRNDEDLIFGKNLTLANNAGISIGESNATVWLHRLNNDVALDNLHAGANILLRTMDVDGYTPNIIVRVDGAAKAIGINPSGSPTLNATLDIQGSLFVSTGTTINGSATIGGNLQVSGTGTNSFTGLTAFTSATTFSDTITTKSIIPVTDNAYTLGDPSHRFNSIYVTTLDVNTATVITATTAFANRLTTSTIFTMQGDIYTTGTTTTTTFTGAGGNIVFNTKLSREAVLSQTTATTALDNDYLMIANVSAMSKITKGDFLSAVTPRLSPTGSIVAWATTATIVSPPGWVFCNGDLLLKTSYPDLFSAIGVTYGGNVTQFKVPDITDLVAGQIKYIIKY